MDLTKFKTCRSFCESKKQAINREDTCDIRQTQG
jgi:hypothetical protein